MEAELLPIGKAAKRIGVSIQTLRRWEKDGKLRAVRSGGGHRYFRQEDVARFWHDLPRLAEEWAESSQPTDFPPEYYCQDSSVFAARLQRFERDLCKDQKLQDVCSLVSSVAGEIGNNSFDHNLANWPDVPGIFFGYDITHGYAVLADRGQGILRTLSRVKPGLISDEDALQVAFTEFITGREPEHRGNGLKYVRKIVTEHHLRLLFRTGNAELSLHGDDRDLRIALGTIKYQGCFAQLFFRV